MPLLKLHTSVSVPVERQGDLAKALSEIIARVLGKPMNYVMVTLSEGLVCMAGDVAPAAFVDVRSIGGLGSAVNKQISEQICALLKKDLDISGDRVYLNFQDVQRNDWGWDSGTFG
ncbi:MAG: light-inducible protein [Proteobacteria bacterium]|nr:light-inducible protein [Pseudomonadota bacterium]